MNRYRLFLLPLLLGLLASLVQAKSDYDPTVQSPALIHNEAQTVYLGNLARRQNGVPPLRWNHQLTLAARWFSWDSVENQPVGYCGHKDSQGHWPSDRIVTFGYRGIGGAENAYCGYVTPEQAITGWLASPGHRANLLDPNSREVGLGYYRRESDGRGYVTQAFGHDPAYPPLIIDNEALATADLAVDLYIYDREPDGGFTAMEPAEAMQVSNDACFTNAVWEPYQPEKTWQLQSGGEGWRSVYVRTRDSLSRTTTVSDTIYFGENLPLSELNSAQMSTTTDHAALYGLGHPNLPKTQFSLNWRVDDQFETFDLLSGSGEPVSDPAAWGQTAFRLGIPADETESSAWVWTTDFLKAMPLVAYVRLKVADNSAAEEVARVAVTGGETLSLPGTAFQAADTYQEFPLSFTWPAAETFLKFQFWRSGSTELYIDAISIFTAPQTTSPTMNWPVPGGNYRGQNVWVRYTDGADQFSTIIEAESIKPILLVKPDSHILVASLDGRPTPVAIFRVEGRCPPLNWQAESSASWLQLENLGSTLRAGVDISALTPGHYTTTITVSSTETPGVAPVTIPITLWVFEQSQTIYLPLLQRQ